MTTNWQSRIVRHGQEAPDQLLANPANWRRHPPKQREAVAGLLDRVGWVQDVIVNERTGFVVDGHLRIEEAISRGAEFVPVVYVDLDPAEEALVLASLDPLAAMAVTDDEALARLLGGVSAEGALAEMLANLSGNAAKAGLTDPDAVPETPAEPTTKPGDLWLLGEHRVLCGDSTKAEDVGRCLGGEKPNLMVTDPPYGVDYDPEWRNEAAEKGLLSYAASRVGSVSNDDRADWAEAWHLFAGAVVYCWHADRHASAVEASLIAAGFETRNQIIWTKSNFPISRGHYTYQHEGCWYLVRKGATASWVGDARQSTVWPVNLDPNAAGGHSTQKPVECMAHPIRNHEGDVYDPFLGSGTTLIACEQLGRRCFGIEIEPRYVDVIVRRWEQFTGCTAVLDG